MSTQLLLAAVVKDIAYETGRQEVIFTCQLQAVIYVQLYTAVRLAVSSNGSADVSSILTESDTSLAAKLNVISNQPVPDPVKVGKSFTARLTGLGRKTGTATPDASVVSRPSISQR